MQKNCGNRQNVQDIRGTQIFKVPRIVHGIKIVIITHLIWIPQPENEQYGN